jgi:hypothetical protein
VATPEPGLFPVGIAAARSIWLHAAAGVVGGALTSLQGMPSCALAIARVAFCTTILCGLVACYASVCRFSVSSQQRTAEQ